MTSRNIAPTGPRNWRQLPGNYFGIFWKLISRARSAGNRSFYFVRSRILLSACNLHPPDQEKRREDQSSLAEDGPAVLVCQPRCPPCQTFPSSSWSLCWSRWWAGGRRWGGPGEDLLWWRPPPWGGERREKVAMVGHERGEPEVLLGVVCDGWGPSRWLEDHLVHPVDSLSTVRWDRASCWQCWG